SAFGDGEWTRDLLQSVHERLVEGGRLWASTDSPRDKWLRTELERLFDRVSAHVQKQGVVYVARKTGPGPRKKLKDYSAEFRFRDGERLLRVVTRPGVFSHRHLDTGARALIEKVVVRPGDRVADIGCGAGVVALALAAREPTCRVTAVDSNARAVECTRRNAELNEFSNIEVRHDADGCCGEPGTFDLVVGNPPYYSNHQIAAIFVDGARAALRPGGLLQIVTKDARWYCENLVDDFDEIQVEPSRAYLIVSARRR
ncbi:MAG TPA: methyltransferase, partial [Pirellulaceae bacterium]|nr:methyltransferase [Pirellulaceae bacterium]